MHRTADEDGLTVVGEESGSPADDVAAATAAEDGHPAADDDSNAELESLRDAFVDAFNDRDLEALLGLVEQDVDVPDVPGGDDGPDVLADELCAMWERSPGAILTRAHWDGRGCAMAWLPDEEGCWTRAGIWLFDAAGGLLTMVACPDDPDALDRAEAEDPTGEELEEWRDWGEWESGAETPPSSRS